MLISSSESIVPLVAGSYDFGFSDTASFAGSVSRSGLLKALDADPFPE